MISEINEMIDYICDSYQEYISMNRGERYAVARIFDEYDVYEDDDESIVEDVVTMLAIGEMIIDNNCLYIQTVERMKKSLCKVEMFKNILKNEIKEDELNNLLMRIKKVEDALFSVEITNAPNY